MKNVFKYGNTSQRKLNTIDLRLQEIFKKAIAIGLIDITIITGSRGEDEQNDLCQRGLSKCQWPDSKHNIIDTYTKSKAVDAAPYVKNTVSYNHKHCCFLAGIVQSIGADLGYKIRWGGNWDMDGEPITDQDFQDLLHYEILD